MRTRIVASLVLAVAGFLTLSLTGQERPPATQPAAVKAASPPYTPTTLAPNATQPARDWSKLNDLQRQMLLATQRGTEWLYRMNSASGRFVHGIHPATAEFMEGDDYLRQATAAFALTRAVKTFLFGVTPNDPATFFTVAAVLAAAALAACYLPARRAAQVDPLRALRTE